MDLTNIRKIQELSRSAGLNPSRLSGQNFLIDENVLKKIIQTAYISKEDRILEIGPGFGVLTKSLLNSGSFVLAVERDKKLAQYLRAAFAGHPHLQIIVKDILDVSNQQIYDALGGHFRVVSNIPYQITGKIIKKFVSSELPKPTRAILLVQKEVAERVCAEPGKMSLLALSVQAYGSPRIAFDVPKTSFWPVPKVDSAALAIEDISESLRTLGEEFEKRFWQIARIGFSSPRKQIKNNLAVGLRVDQEAIKFAIKRAGLKETARAQELGTEDWICLASALCKKMDFVV